MLDRERAALTELVGLALWRQSIDTNLAHHLRTICACHFRKPIH